MWLARVNRVALNKTYGRLAGRAPWMGAVIHRGRKSGKEFRTPVNLHRFDGGYRISLDYGPGVDWVRNVVAQGGCSLVDRGQTITLDRPEVIHDPEVSWASPVARRVLKKVGSGYYLQLRIPS
ncbi:hypothetical protein [Smaragdicoccus niigatensis]|uniref:hypothetical protein n=1 Tax=Smaragdicoccus niigatensis TaxID=359359 RepID=UPI00059127B3|nr:hypothetical protein [Smaragdicoccus niigatensis]